MINRKDVYNKYNGRCGYCGSEINIKDMQVDHIIPKRNYLSHIKSKFNIPPFLSHLTEHDMDHIDNLMPSCRVCNNWKKTFHLELFRSEIKEQIKGSMITPQIIDLRKSMDWSKKQIKT